MLTGDKGDRPEPWALDIPDTAWMMGKVSQNHVRNLVRDKVLDSVRVGRRVLITTASIKRVLKIDGTDESQGVA